MHATLPLLSNTNFPLLHRDALETLQVNLGYTCNQSCRHCHVNAGPKRKEQMSLETINQVIQLLKNNKIKHLDITGGAPELNPWFRHLVKEARKLDVHIIDRCNLTILNETGQEDLAEFLAQHRVEIVASLPCYEQKSVDDQRGKGVYNSSIVALQTLNKLGYGKKPTGLELNLMYNPSGESLPPSQQILEHDYKKELKKHFNIVFNHLYTLTNMPIMRFGSTLISKGKFDIYMQVLKDAHQEINLKIVMCRTLISVDWRGYIFDCDFNQLLNLPLKMKHKSPVHICDLNIKELEGNPIVTADHCYGCTAGNGSSCGGSLG